uniref:Ribonuclease P protein component n=1 Tax=candidate division WOR-3 bacterium TaxID=2052148 RepID=A0A7C4CBY2_UNCW3
MAATLPRAGIVRHKSDLKRVMNTGAKAAGSLLSLRFSPRPDSATLEAAGPPSACPPRRVAFLLPRTIKGSVERNRLKRRLREAYRRNQTVFPAGLDLIFFVRPEAVNAGYAELEAEILNFAAKAKR